MAWKASFISQARWWCRIRCDPLAYYRNNTMTTRSLLNTAVKCGINRFIFSSTAAVYGNPDQVPVPEHAPTRPLSPYGRSEEHTSELQSLTNLVCRLLLEKKKTHKALNNAQ